METDPKNEIAEAIAEPIDETESTGWIIGRPFFIVADCDLENAAAIVVCDQCNAKFRIDLADGRNKLCPECKTAFSHALVIARADDDETVDDLLDHLAIVNNADDDQEHNPDDDDHDDAGDEQPDENIAEIIDAETAE